MDPSNSFYSSVNGVLFDKNQTTLILYPAGLAGSYTIPGSVTGIGNEAFYECTRLTNIFFMGNAPVLGGYNEFTSDDNTTAYYLPGTSGWADFSDDSGMPAVLWNPLIQGSGSNLGVGCNQFGFNISGTPNIPIVIEACSNLASSVWTPLQSFTLTNGSFYLMNDIER